MTSYVNNKNIKYPKVFVGETYHNSMLQFFDSDEDVIKECHEIMRCYYEGK